MFLQQVTGINAVMFYAEIIFEDANFKVISLCCQIGKCLLFQFSRYWVSLKHVANWLDADPARIINNSLGFGL